MNRNRRGSIALYRRLLGHLRPHWRPFALAVLAMLLAAAAQPAIPMILKPVLDESFVDRDPQSVAGLTVMLVLAFVVWGFANWARTAAFSVVSQRVLFDLRLAMLDKLLAPPHRAAGPALRPPAHVENDLRRESDRRSRGPHARGARHRRAGRHRAARLDGLDRLAAHPAHDSRRALRRVDGALLQPPSSPREPPRPGIHGPGQPPAA